jgi:hypothetical protein
LYRDEAVQLKFREGDGISPQDGARLVRVAFVRAFYLVQALSESLKSSARRSVSLTGVGLRGVLPFKQADGLGGLYFGVGHVTAGKASDVETIEVASNLTIAFATATGLEDNGVLVKSILDGSFLTHWIFSPGLFKYSKLLILYTIEPNITLTECERFVNVNSSFSFDVTQALRGLGISVFAR